MSTTHPATIIVFVLYVIGTFVLAALSNRLFAKKSFLAEYFLGSRGLGSWTLAFTFAATSASGGSFTGFPSLIYSYGWVLALWIASYMVVPVCTMGVLGKRLNQVARKSGAITIPDVLRDRFESTALGLFAACTIIFFTVSNLVAQFRVGGIILEKTLNLPPEWGTAPGGESWAYIIGLLLFAVVVIFYTCYGGFRAVVWTDVMQGIIMGAGIVLMLPVVLSLAGGLGEVNRKLREQPPLAVTAIGGQNNDLAYLLQVPEGKSQPLAGVEYVIGKPGEPAAVRIVEEEGKRWLQVRFAANAEGEPVTTASQIKDMIESDPDIGQQVEIKDAYDNNGENTWQPKDDETRRKRWRFVRGEEHLFGPGRKPDGSPFHPLGLAISFFFMWAISGMGQPGTMVRLMAFKDSTTLKRAIVVVTFYFGVIYLPLVFIFVAARTLLPYIPPGESDYAMVLLSTRVIADISLGHAILAAVLVAAPFAAVMSTVDSFLLVVSSGCVRDIYQRTLNPDVSERVVKRISYATTAIVGVVASLLAMKQINFIQYIIVFTGGGFAATFLAPVFLGVYWKGMTRQGALAAMVGGFLIVVGMFAPSLLGGQRVNLFGFHPIFWGLFGSFALGIVVSKLTGPPPQHLIDLYFRRPK